MGMMRNGVWSDKDNLHENGAFKRPATKIRNDPAEIGRIIDSRPGRVHLIASHSCPWSHRATITRGLKGLRTVVPVYFAYGRRTEGYALADGALWTVPGSQGQIRHLHELYSRHDQSYHGRVSIPVLWDSQEGRIVSNESAEIMEGLDAARSGAPGSEMTLFPERLRPVIDDANDWIYTGLNNAVYRAGFAKCQAAYDEAVETVFETLEQLEVRLAHTRFYFDSHLTATDIRILPTLIRFDAIYHVLFKCCRRRLIDFPNLWAFARDLYSMPGVSETVDFNAMRQASYSNDGIGQSSIVAVAPDMDWTERTERNLLGAINGFNRAGQTHPWVNLNLADKRHA